MKDAGDLAGVTLGWLGWLQIAFVASGAFEEGKAIVSRFPKARAGTASFGFLPVHLRWLPADPLSVLADPLSVRRSTRILLRTLRSGSVPERLDSIDANGSGRVLPGSLSQFKEGSFSC